MCKYRLARFYFASDKPIQRFPVCFFFFFTFILSFWSNNKNSSMHYLYRFSFGHSLRWKWEKNVSNGNGISHHGCFYAYQFYAPVFSLLLPELRLFRTRKNIYNRDSIFVFVSFVIMVAMVVWYAVACRYLLLIYCELIFSYVRVCVFRVYLIFIYAETKW